MTTFFSVLKNVSRLKRNRKQTEDNENTVAIKRGKLNKIKRFYFISKRRNKRGTTDTNK